MARIKFADGTIIDFEGQPTPQDIEEAYSQVQAQKSTGVSQSADQQALGALKANKQKSADEYQQTRGFVQDTFGDTAASVLDKAKTIRDGGTDAWAKLAGGIGTFANSKLNFSDNPALKSGTESNKYLLRGITDDGEGMFKSDSLLGKTTDALMQGAMLMAPGMGGTKLASTANNVLNATKVGGMIQKGGLIGKSIPLATEALGQTAAGSAFTTLQNGGYKDGDFSKDLALNTAIPVVGSMVGKMVKGVLGTTPAGKLNAALNSGDKEQVQKALTSTDYINSLIKKGIRVVDGVPDQKQLEQVASKELAGVREKMLQSNISLSKKNKLKNIFASDTDNGATATFVGNLSKKMTDKGGFDASDTINNLSEYTDNIFANNRIGDTLSYLGKQDLPINKIHPAELKNGFLELINGSDLNAAAKERGRAVLNTYFNDTEIKNILNGNSSIPELLDSVRRATNEKFIPEHSDANLVIGNKIREIFDDLANGADGLNIDETARDGIKALQKANRAYADAQKAKLIAQAIDNVSVGGKSGLVRLVGGVIATGGSYNPWLFLAGSIGAESIANITNNALTRNMFRTGISEGMQYASKNLDEINNLTKNIPKKPVTNTILDTLSKPNTKKTIRDDIMGILKTK